jgi:MFS family permease
MSDVSSPGASAESGVRSILSNRGYTLYLVSITSMMIATQMLSVAVGWQLYEITGDALALGFSGLALFLPAFLLALPGGHLADRHDRRRILAACHLAVAACAATLALLARGDGKRLAPIYAVLVGFGAIRAFSGPASQALMPNLVEKTEVERAVALSSSSWQLATIAGPALGGAIYAATGRASVVYIVCAAMALLAFAAVVAIGPVPMTQVASGRATLSTVLAGLRYVWSDKPILGAISLDLFAVLLGGAVALLPIFSRDLLHVGPWGLGILRSAPGIGATMTAMFLAWFPTKRRAGVTMFACVFLFGIATIIFGISKNFALSLIALLVIGAADMFSIVVRFTLIQVRTADAMRGRVSAVNMLFVGASNELGEFESGVTAAWLGPELAVVIGGAGTCLVVIVWALLFSELRSVDRLAPEK